MLDIHVIVLMDFVSVIFQGTSYKETFSDSILIGSITLCSDPVPLVWLQAFGRRHPDCSEPGGELWSSRSPADPPGHHHYAPLRRGRQRGLAHSTQEPITAGPMGGEWEGLGHSLIDL